MNHLLFTVLEPLDTAYGPESHPIEPVDEPKGSPRFSLIWRMALSFHQAFTGVPLENAGPTPLNPHLRPVNDPKMNA